MNPSDFKHCKITRKHQLIDSSENSHTESSRESCDERNSWKTEGFFERFIKLR